MNHDGGETYTSERKQCDMTNKVKPNKHRGFLDASKMALTKRKDWEVAWLKPTETKNPPFWKYLVPAPAFSLLNSTGVKRSLNIGRYEEIQRRGNHSLKGTSRRSSTFECDGASAVTKVHIRNAPMSWRVNEYVQKRKSFSDCEVPESFQLRILATLLETQQIFDVRGFLLENFIQQFSNCSACRRVIFDRPVVFQLLCEMSAEQNAVSECQGVPTGGIREIDSSRRVVRMWL